MFGTRKEMKNVFLTLALIILVVILLYTLVDYKLKPRLKSGQIWDTVASVSLTLTAVWLTLSQLGLPPFIQAICIGWGAIAAFFRWNDYPNDRDMVRIVLYFEEMKKATSSFEKLQGGAADIKEMIGDGRLQADLELISTYDTLQQALSCRGLAECKLESVLLKM